MPRSGPLVGLFLVWISCATPHDAAVEPAAEASVDSTVRSAADDKRAPAMVVEPKIQPDFLLSEKLNWLQDDFEVVLRITIGPTGEVTGAEISSISAEGKAVVRDYADFLARSFRLAVYEPPGDVAFPYTFRTAVRFHARRGAGERLE